MLVAGTLSLCRWPRMKDSDCIGFLQWALPQLRLRWAGFRKVRKQVCKRVARRLRVLDLPGPASYRDYLNAHPDEWTVLDRCCRITLSRFYRDQRTFDVLGQAVLPLLAQQALQRGDSCLRLWSAGCAAGEEAYSLVLLWERRVAPLWPAIGMQILGTDADPHSLDRAVAACYAAASLKELPVGWRDAAFRRRDAYYCLRARYRAAADFQCQDLRSVMPARCFDLILCRNLVFTYFSEELQMQMLQGLQERLQPGGVLAIGAHESLPDGVVGFTPWPGIQGIFRAGGAGRAH